jgi:hypothetical protein
MASKQVFIIAKERNSNVYIEWHCNCFKNLQVKRQMNVSLLEWIKNDCVFGSFLYSRVPMGWLQNEVHNWKRNIGSEVHITILHIVINWGKSTFTIKDFRHIMPLI